MSAEPRSSTDRFVWGVVAVLALAWGLVKAAWALDDHFVPRRDFEYLSRRVEAIAQRLGVEPEGSPGPRR